MAELEIVSYEEWIKAHPEVLLEESPCPECYGDGTSECEECGHESDCPECEGTGKILTARMIYEQQLHRDHAALARYQADMAEVAP